MDNQSDDIGVNRKTGFDYSRKNPENGSPISKEEFLQIINKRSSDNIGPPKSK